MLYQLLLIRKRSLLAIRPANGGGEGDYTRGAVVGAEAEEMRDWRRGLRRRCGTGGGIGGEGV